MSLNNLTKNNNANVSNVLSKFYSKRSEELIENEREPEFTKNTILIPRRKISQLQNASGFFEAFIDRDFSNSNEYFDSKGNYILKKELLPETFYFYDKKGNAEYIIKRDEVWKALPKALLEGHIPDPILAELIADWFMFKTNSFFRPTLPMSEAITKSNRYYLKGPSKYQLKKQRRENRTYRKFRNEIYGNNNNNNNYLPLSYRRLSKNELLELMKEEERHNKINELKNELRREKKENVEDLAEALQDIFTKKQNISRAISESEKATSNRTKYGKSKTMRKKPLGEMRKEKRRSLRRERARVRKTMKHKPLGNDYNNYNNNNNNNNDE